MKNNIAKIRTALEWGEGPVFVEALAALAELEKAAAEPVAWQWSWRGNWEPMIELPASRPPDGELHEWRPLYAAPPVPRVDKSSDPDTLPGAPRSPSGTASGEKSTLAHLRRCRISIQSIVDAINGRE